MLRILEKRWYIIAIWLVIVPLGAIAVAGLLGFCYKAITCGL